MKKLIVCEGKNDMVFLKSALKRFGHDEGEIQTFPQELGADTAEKKHAETVVMKKFFESTSPHKVLIKSENGNQSVIGFISDILAEVQRCNIIILLDLDNNDWEYIMAPMKDVVQSRRKSVLKHKEISNFNGLRVSEIAIQKGEDSIGKFHLIVFDSCLEKDAGIDNEKDKERRHTKIRKFAESKNFHKSFASVLSNETNYSPQV